MLHSFQQQLRNRRFFIRTTPLAPLSSLGLARVGRFKDGPLYLGVQHTVGNLAPELPTPFVSEDGAVCVAFAGDVVNFSETRRRLEVAGRCFRHDRSSGELIYHLYQHGDASLISRVDGSFCFAMWNSRSQLLTLVPDRIGMRPFFFYFNGEVFVFSTTIKGVLAHDAIPRAFNSKVLFELLAIGITVPHDTMFEHVRALRANEYLEFNGAVSVKRRPARRFSVYAEGDAETRMDRYVDVLQHSVINCIAGQRAGILLSGGVDSGTLVSIALRLGIPIRSYTIDLSQGRGELKGARTLAELYKTDHRETVRLPEDAMEYLPEVVWFFEAVGVNCVNFVSEYLFGRSVDADLDVLLTGDGNDLTWGAWAPPPDVLSETKKSFSELYDDLRSVTPARVVETLARAEYYGAAYVLEKIESLRPYTGSLYSDAIAVDASVYGENAACKMVGRVRFDPTTQRYRFPYLASEVKACVDSLPIDDKFRMENGKRTTKFLFKRALQRHGLLPEEIINRKKAVMYSPAKEWLRGESGTVVERILFREGSAIARYCNEQAVRELWSLHRTGVRNHTTLLMTLLSFEVWHRLFIDSSGLERPAVKLRELF